MRRAIERSRLSGTFSSRPSKLNFLSKWEESWLPFQGWLTWGRENEEEIKGTRNRRRASLGRAALGSTPRRPLVSGVTLGELSDLLSFASSFKKNKSTSPPISQDCGENCRRHCVCKPRGSKQQCPRLFAMCLFLVLVTCGQLLTKNVQWKNPRIK